MKRELRDVLRLLEELERALREKEMLALTLGREIKELTALLDRLEEEKREAEKQAMTSGTFAQAIGWRDVAGARTDCDICEREMQRLAAERQEQESLIASRQAELATIEEARDQFEMQLAAGQERLAALRGQRDTAAETTSQRAARVATLEERHRSATTLLQRIETLVAEMRERAGALQVANGIGERRNRAAARRKCATGRAIRRVRSRAQCWRSARRLAAARVGASAGAPRGN